MHDVHILFQYINPPKQLQKNSPVLLRLVFNVELNISYENTGSSAAVCKAELGLITKQAGRFQQSTMRVPITICSSFLQYCKLLLTNTVSHQCNTETFAPALYLFHWINLLKGPWENIICWDPINWVRCLLCLNGNPTFIIFDMCLDLPVFFLFFQLKSLRLMWYHTPFLILLRAFILTMYCSLWSNTVF